MKVRTNPPLPAILLCSGLLACFTSFAQAPQASDAGPAQTTAQVKRFSIGLRGRALPLRSFSAMESQTTLSTTTTPLPVRDWNFTTASHATSWGVGPAFEYLVSPRVTITAEVIYSRLRYTKVTSVYSGTDDATTTADERTKLFHTEDTRGILWDAPLLVHLRGVKSSGPLSKIYVAAGGALRTVTNLRSTTVTTNSDSSTSTDKTPAPVARRNLPGAVIGLGFRIVDDFNITWTPEIRYTRWAGSTFSADSTMSPRNQLEVGMAITF